VIGFSHEKATTVENMAKMSMGASITDFELTPLQQFSLVTDDLFNVRDQLALYVDEAMQLAAPNMRAIVGSLLGARLISIAGGMANLAKMPASTIQVLGAEKALFRSLRTGARPPKHGIIFQWEEIHGAPYWLKGKIARALAGKLSIAARVDYFSGDYIGENILADLNHRINDIKNKYPSAPKKPKMERKEPIDRRKPEQKKSNKFKKKWKKEKRDKKKKLNKT
jgi:nucleolar protein 56